MLTAKSTHATQTASQNFSYPERALWEKVKALVRLIPPNCDWGTDPTTGSPIMLTSYILSKAVSQYFELTSGIKLECVVGVLPGKHSHTWLKTLEGNILDVVPRFILGNSDGPILSCHHEVYMAQAQEITSHKRKTGDLTSGYWIDQAIKRLVEYLENADNPIRISQ